MSRPYISKAVRHRVAIAARHRCGYCLTSQKYTGAQLQLNNKFIVSVRGYWTNAGWHPPKD